MKLIVNLIGLIIGFASIVLLIFEMILFLCLSKQAYLWGKKKVHEIHAEQIERFTFVKTELSGYKVKFDGFVDACGISLKAIANHGIRFILLMIIPVSVILLLYSYRYASSYENLQLDKKLLEDERVILENVQNEFKLEKKLDSLNKVMSIQAEKVDTTVTPVN